MRMIDLFAGIGTASLAADIVWGNVEHEFVEINPYGQTILRKHFPDAKIFGDITKYHYDGESVDIFWGSPPCQAASSAGKRKGTSDDRWLWPDFFRVVAESRPKWIVAENVRGLLSLNEGLEYEKLCVELEDLGYEIASFLIPACAVGAPHRRDRVWIVGRRNEPSNSPCRQDDGRERGVLAEKEGGRQGGDTPAGIGDKHDASDSKCFGNAGGFGSGAEQIESSKNAEQYREYASDSDNEGLEGEQSWGILQGREATVGHGGQGGGAYGWKPNGFPDWSADWKRVAAETCSRIHGVDDGPQKRVYRLADGTEIGEARLRVERLKACGNGLVLQVVIEIFKAIKHAEEHDTIRG